MRQITISRPRRFECAAVALRVEVNGKKLAKLRNDKRIVMQVDEGKQVIRVHGGFFGGKAFQDTIKIPAGQHEYDFQVDFISAAETNYVPILRPCGGEFVKDDTRTVTLLGATLCKYLLEESVREMLRNLPDASIKVMLMEKEWRLVLFSGAGGKILLRSEYSRATGGLSAAIVNAIEHSDLGSQEGRDKLLEKIMTDYVAWLPEYERQGKYGVIFKG